MFGGAYILFETRHEPTWKDKAACAGVRSYYLDVEGRDMFLISAVELMKANVENPRYADIAIEHDRVFEKMYASEDADYLAKRLVDRCL